MALIRYRPFGNLDRLHHEMHRLFDDLSGSENEEELSSSEWTPGININERKDDFVITADLPGIQKKDISINLDNRVLTMGGERKFEKDDKKDNYHRVEKSYGRFCRSFRLPDTIDDNTVKAEYKNGELTITLKKQEAAKPKHIPVKIV